MLLLWQWMQYQLQTKKSIKPVVCLKGFPAKCYIVIHFLLKGTLEGCLKPKRVAMAFRFAYSCLFHVESSCWNELRTKTSTRMIYADGLLSGGTVSFRECISVKISVVLGEQATTGTSIQGTFLFNGFHFETCYGAPGRRTAAEAPKWRDLSFSIGYFLRFRVKFSGARRIIWWELDFHWNKHMAPETLGLESMSFLLGFGFRASSNC